MDKYTLNNGLRVVVEKIPTTRSVAFGIWVKTGSRHESQSQNGISHFIEHMLFKGTDKYSAKDIAEIFDGIGGNVNAFTSKEYTCYYCKVLDEHLPLAVDVLSDMFFNSVLDPAELAKEKNVIYEEISMYEDTPDDMVHDLIAKAAFEDHSLGYTIIGTQQNLAAMDSGTLRDYMNSHYTIGNTVISIAGNVNDDVIALMEKHFGAFAAQGTPSEEQPLSFHSNLQYHKKKTEQNHICLSLPGLSAKDERLYAMVLLNNAIGGGMSSRLFQEIREKRGLAYSVYSYHTSYQDGGLFTIYTGTAPKQTDEVLKVTLEMMSDLKEKGLSEAELRKGKEQMKGSLILSLESTSARMNRLGKNELMLGRHYSLDEMIERVEAVEMEHITGLIGSMLSSPFAVAMVGQNDTAIQGFRRDILV
ncbi:M16 family metallopeptidase [Paenibacillus mucilaginosus]|uniref:YmxG n=3 Tax=Paenibacillus mucilaginosus TaxID=61624 RepID=H6NPB8_9BACL|nr:pitrilysin family protein [Paenibacillus mucilaginosus]AEI44287.1 YmxG [Paenibacillus mucilaginosus KNP414]AFC31828.1 YmxG [Paenibacillus mucilaginosus 3016]AFH64184.1 zinc protease [Paenibacillus mucilaginosus K02]MCG7216694.1 insulinase family protein [Paenibacillus mucilaginosus]WDM25685.1 insulinase family protein [Paenibacillus mucilaginosus]